MSINRTIKWFPFLEIMEYTGNDMQNDSHLTSSSLKMFSMFGIRFSVGDVDLDEVSSKCINCERKKEHQRQHVPSTKKISSY